MLVGRKIYKVELKFEEGIETNYVYDDALIEILKQYPREFVSAEIFGMHRVIEDDKL